MIVWFSLAGALILWALAAGFLVRRWKRDGRIHERARIDQEVRELYDTPEGLRLRVAAEPDNPVPAIRLALLAQAEQDWPEMLSRAEAIAHRFPRISHGPYLMALALWELGQQDRSIAVTRRLRRRFPENADVLSLALHQARSRGDIRMVRRIGRRMRIEHPVYMIGFSSEFDALLVMGRLRQAERVLRLAEAELPEDGLIPQMWDRLDAARAGAPGPAAADADLALPPEQCMKAPAHDAPRSKTEA